MRNNWKFCILFICLLIVVFSGKAIIKEKKPSRIIHFSGFKWKVKHSDKAVGPGGNHFSKSKQNVWVDKEGNLHLKITSDKGIWQCAEVICMSPLGYGTYQFKIDSSIDRIDPNIVLGLFLYDLDVELDIEFSRWGEKNNPNGQYAVQPMKPDQRINRFNFYLHGNYSQHHIKWWPNDLYFASFHGHGDMKAFPNQKITDWKCPGKIPGATEATQVRFNLWLFQHQAPQNNQECEVIIKEFSFTPWGSD